MVLLTTGLHQSALAQQDNCSKPKVAVIMNVEEVDEGEFNKHLNEQYPSQPKGSWLYEIQEKVMEELRMNSPDTQFIPATEGIPSDCDYLFKYVLLLTGGGETIEYAGHLELSEDTFYQMRSQLLKTPPCGEKDYVLSVKSTRNRGIFHTIEQNIVAHGNIGNKIKEHEESHRVPPRGPEIKVSQDRKYVSPLEKERKLQLKIDVINCKGEPVFDKNHGQHVTLSKETERGKLECTPHSAAYFDCKESSNKLELTIQTPTGASAIYALKKGVNPAEVPIKIETCGIDRKAVEETKIQIHGLELKVKPEKKEVFPGDETKITIKLSEVDTKGTKQPVAGKRIQLKISGLIDGHVYPPGDATTDQNGEAILTYEAGDKDKKVIIKATFQPKDYPESIKDETAITVSRYEGQAIVKITENGKFTTEDGVETTSATINFVLKYTHTQVDEDRGFVECYDLISWNVSDAMATWTVKDDQGTHKHETYKVKKEEMDNEEKTDQLLIFFDENGKAESIEPPNVGYWFIFDDLYGVRLDPLVDPNNYVDVKGGDGIHEMVGGGTGVVGGLEYTVKWEIKRYRK